MSQALCGTPGAAVFFGALAAVFFGAFFRAFAVFFAAIATQHSRTPRGRE
jgi:hypothetical protein